ncbi:MAG: DsrE family protein [Betaproteobacteria bacterium]|jgi:intracellular sulfur oxidation DsrE/DsrF family protein
MMSRLIVLVFALYLPAAAASADAAAPWGRAGVVEKTYSKQKVVYDVAVKTVAQLENVLDRASYLSALNDADPFDSKIVIVLHGDEIGFFALRNFEKYRELMVRAQSLTVGGIIDMRMCRVSAHRRGFEPSDIHGFVTMVPMADAEIIDLQKQGFAYMQ